ncbi:Arm domain-containing protein/F-box-like domain-containing protein [Heracleum sosnowskyi]|uniref:Arm domain-containing protein/F-box-like domain-containing protein n=1 Tax=Heracleum sosnowskyi TaxID=360622 RepID=A0AAD8HEG0_9APIA|nr:Arm domain-containing protein/F-box-like domain-containing protein [Heracleum sosnowskyi]
MSQRVCKKVLRTGNEIVDLPDDIVIEFFSRLNYQDRANLSATCSSWRLLGRSQRLWQLLDLRMHKFNVNAAEVLASRCVGLKKVQFYEEESATALIDLRARNLKEITGGYCVDMSDEALILIASNHKAVEILQLGPGIFERITSDAITEVAGCCSKLKKLRLSGIKYVDGVAINALARNCPNLTEIGFINCLNIDMKTFGDVLSLRFLSVAGSLNINWILASESLSTLPHLKCLDVSRTEIVPDALSRLLSTSKNLLILCALSCPAIDTDPSFVDLKNINGKLLINLSTDIFKGVCSLFAKTAMEERDVFSSWRNSIIKEQGLTEIMIWLEWILSDSLLLFAVVHPTGLNNYWLSQGVKLLLSLTKSSQEDVQERALEALSTFAVNYVDGSIDFALAEAVAQEGGILPLLNLAKSFKEGLQFRAAVAIENLLLSPKVRKVVEEVGGLNILVDLARSTNRWIAQRAAGGLLNLSSGEIDKDAYAGVVQVLVDVISKWCTDANVVADEIVDELLKCAAGVLANLAVNNKYGMLIVEVGGLTPLVRLARRSRCVQKQVARTLANLAAHRDINFCNTAVEKEIGAVEALVQLLHSPCNGVRKEAVVAVSNLCFYARNREAIAAAGGVDALVSLAHICACAPHEAHDLQERVVRALREFSVSEAHSILIGAQGGIASFLILARSVAKDVHESAAEALWALSFHPMNAIQIVHYGGLQFLANCCTSSMSKVVQFVSALTLAYTFDGRMEEFCLSGASSEDNLKSRIDAFRFLAMKSIDDFICAYSDPQLLSAVATSSSPALLTQVAESAHILEAGHLRCSGAEIERLTVMLRNSSNQLKICAAFALLQFTFPGNQHAPHHASLLQNTRARAAVRAAAMAATASIQSKIFAKIVLRNLEHHQEKTLC